MPDKINNNCIFCKIANKQIPTDFEYQNDEVVAFKDINPQAPIHIIIIPKDHIERVSDLDLQHRNLIADLILVANELAKKKNIKDTGYRLVINCNKDAGQAVFHLHLHLLGGRPMHWPPG
jgi:histidine triad (HIT) family protein